MDTDSKNKIYFSLAFVFSLMILLYYPLGLVRAISYKNPISNWSELEGFTWEIAGFFALGMILLKTSALIDFLKKNKITAVGSAFFILILILQQIFIFPSFYNFGGGLSYLALIGAGFLYGREFKKVFLPLFWILLLFSLLMDLHDVFTPHASGLTGNWNWSATLILVLSWSIFFIFRKKIPEFEGRWGIYCGAFTLITLIYLYFSCHFPKGTILSTVVSAGVLVWCYLDYFFDKKTRYIMLGVSVIVFALFAVMLKDFIGAMLVGDTRTFLWENGLKVFIENPLIGCEYGRYISESAGKMSLEYFLTDHAASVHTHPHSEFLFLLASFGLGGLVIIFIMLYVFVRGIKFFERRKTFENGYFLFIFTVLFVHSFFDVLLLHWPGNMIFFLLCGALIPIMDPEKDEQCEEKHPLCNIVAAAVPTILGLYLLCMNFMASMYYRMSMSIKNNSAKRLEIVQKSISFHPTYKTVNDEAVLYSMLNEPHKAAEILENMSVRTGVKTFSHSNLSIAIFHLRSNQIEKALPYFVNEYENFPLSVRNLVFFSQALQELGRNDESAAVEQEIDNILQLKGLTRKHLPTLVYDEKTDLNSAELLKRK